MLSSKNRRPAGITLVEVMVTVLLGGLLLLALASLRSSTAILVRKQKQTLIATCYLQDRLNQLRAFAWGDLTTKQKVEEFISGPDAVQPLSARGTRKPVKSETIEVRAWSLASSTNTPFGTSTTKPISFFELQRNIGSSATTTSTGSSSAIDSAAAAVSVKVTVSWDNGSVIRSRSMSCLVSRLGINR